MKSVAFAIALLLGVVAVSAQPSPVVADKFAAERALATKVVEAHGGTKFRDMTSLVINGSVDITASNFPQSIPATFIMILAGDKYRIELTNPFQPLKQTFDGIDTVSTAPGGMKLPPINRLGLPLISKLDTVGFVLTSLPESKKKRSGFRITSPEGYFTDFFIDPKTNLVKSYESSYSIDGRQITTSVEIDKMKTVDGITVPERYVQRFDLGQFAVYGNFKAKEISVNTAVEDGIFKAAK
jgi:hypothetical protein